MHNGGKRFAFWIIKLRRISDFLQFDIVNKLRSFIFKSVGLPQSLTPGPRFLIPVPLLIANC